MKKTILFKLRELFFAHFLLKAGSLIIAVFIWFSVASEGRADRTFTEIPYDLRNIPMSLEVTDRGIGLVKITARGPQHLISSLTPDNITIPLNLPDDAAPGEMTLSIKPENIQTPYPNKISILQVSPSNITIKLEKTTTKVVRIRPFLKGLPASGYELTRWEVSPPNAEIRGPVSIVERLDQIFTEPVDISGMNMTFNERVLVKATEKFVKVLRPSRVTVTVVIEEKIIERTFPEFEFQILTLDSEPSLSVEPSVTTLTIRGPMKLVTSLQPKDFNVVADCTNLPPGNHVVMLTLRNPNPGISEFIMDPDRVNVHIPEPFPAATPHIKKRPVNKRKRIH